MGSSKKHKKHKSERREKYEEYSNNMDPSQLQRGLKLILKVGSNSTPEYGSADSPAQSMAMNYAASSSAGPPTAAEAMMAAAPSSDLHDEEENFDAEYRGERHKKSKKKKKKKDREKKHKHHKEKRHRSERHEGHNRQREHEEHQTPEQQQQQLETQQPTFPIRSPKSMTQIADGDSSQDAFSFIDENSQPLPENILFYAGITTDNSPSCRPVSKPIIARKTDELLMGSSPASLSQHSAQSTSYISPTKPLPDLHIPSMSPSTAASTPGGNSSLNALTPKPLEAPKTPSSCSDSGREPRTCVLKLKQQKSPLNKLLDHLLRFLEKRDPHQFFAWPVTDDIAPGYSTIITRPMDFSTMRQKIEDNDYTTLIEFTDDFKLMCENAIRYNHIDTVYNKAAKRLLQVGSKHLLPENLMRSLKPLSGYMRELTAKELGFELLQGVDFPYDHHGMADSADEGASTGADEPTAAQLEEEEKRRNLRLENAPKSRYEPFVDDLTSDEILAQVQNAARAAKKRLTHKERAHKMGFLRQNRDGTTSLNLLIKDENEGPEKVVTMGDLVGKLKSGTGQIQGLRVDKRNEAKLVKPLNYGAFATFAPAFDSRFSNLTMEETQLVMRTYGDATSTEYAESILQFTKDSSYATMLATGLLDVLTAGEHSKSMADLYDLQCQNFEQSEVSKCFNNEAPLAIPSSASAETRAQIEQDYEKYKNTMIDFNRLRSLNDLGIDVSFLDDIEVEMKNFELTRRLQEHLSNNLNLIEKLRSAQNDRLSQSLPQHLGQVPQPGIDESHLASQITQQLSDLAKKLPPAAIADTYSVRRAMGMSYVGLPQPLQQQQQIVLPDILQPPVAMPQLHLPPNTLTQPQQQLTTNTSVIHIPSDSAMDIDEDVVGVTTSGVDLENELREFLESGPGLAATSNSDDNSIVAQLLMN